MPKPSIGRWLASKSSTEPTTLDQLGLVVSLAINLMIVLIFLPLILLMWGFQLGDIQAWAYKVGDRLQHRLVPLLADSASSPASSSSRSAIS